ncbi:MAG: ABC transporter permease [Ignavibacteriaceae bacterium]
MKIIRFHQFTALLLAQTKELMREPAVLFWGIVFPILMALGLGLAFTQKAEIVRNIAVTGEGASSNKFEYFLRNRTEKIVSEDNVERYQLTIEDEKLGNTTYIFSRMSWEEAIVQLKRGEISIILEEKNGNIEYNFDPVNPDAQLIYVNLSGIINKGDTELTENNDNIKPLTITGTRYIDFLIPGLISMGIMMSCVWGVGYNMIEKRSKKLLRRMIATPMRKSHFLISMMTVRTAMNFIEGGLLFLFAYIVFDVTIQGSIPALILIFISSNIAFAGIAILTASRTASLEVGNGLINAVITPMIVLSGVFFSYHNFPEWLVSFVKYLPLTLLADGTRSIFIEGAGIAQITLPFFILLLTGIISFWIGLKMFKWH